MIADYLKKVKPWVEKNKSDLFTASAIFLVGLGGFGLGRLSAIWPAKAPLQISGAGAKIVSPQSPDRSPPMLKKETRATVGQYVASKSGSAYHFPWCPGAAKITEKNKIWFATKEEAVAKGYKPAGNCPGLP